MLVTNPLSVNNNGAVATSATALLAAATTSTTSPQSRGAFIVLEGVDRCGKTTQCGLLLEHLLAEGIPAVAKRFPDRTTTVGKMIHQYLTGDEDLDDQASHLLFSANRWEGASQLEYHLLQKGETVICDRYAYSGVAFTSAKPRERKGGPLSFEWCQSPDIGLPAPDAVIFLDLSQEEAEQRGGYGQERYEKRDLQVRVRQQFKKLEKLDRAEGRVPWHIVSAAQSVDAVRNDIWNIVQKTLAQVKCGAGKAVGKLWEEGEYYTGATIHLTTSEDESEKENK